MMDDVLLSPPAFSLSRLPIDREYLKSLPGDGRLVYLLVQVSDDPTPDSALAANGWDILHIGDIRVRFRIEA
jgi:hypothetical protein